MDYQFNEWNEKPKNKLTWLGAAIVAAAIFAFVLLLAVALN